MAAICNAGMDIIAHKYHQSIFVKWNQHFWNPNASWTNKYKSKTSREPKFFGSTTFLVFTTDAWHLFQFLSNSFMVITIMIALSQVKDLVWWEYLIEFAILKVVWGMWFELFYKYIFRSN